MSRFRRRGGFTMIDAVLAVVIVVTSFLALGSVISSTTIQNVDIDFSTTALLLARERMDEVMARDYDSVANAAQANFDGDFSGYHSTVAVTCVAAADLDASTTCPADFKRVAVSVGHPGWSGTITLYNLKADL
ncbi:MAG TPA: hypothetical protein PLZ86_05790 [bacterium]|nr:hypothetical protein [bacterium]